MTGAYGVEERGRCRKSHSAEAFYSAIGPAQYAPVYTPPKLGEWPEHPDLKDENLKVTD